MWILKSLFMLFGMPGFQFRSIFWTKWASSGENRFTGLRFNEQISFVHFWRLCLRDQKFHYKMRYGRKKNFWCAHFCIIADPNRFTPHQSLRYASGTFGWMFAFWELVVHLNPLNALTLIFCSRWFVRSHTAWFELLLIIVCTCLNKPASKRSSRVFSLPAEFWG